MSTSENYLVTKYLNATGATLCPPMHARGTKRQARPLKPQRGQW